jgi:hypothetical protein
MNDYESAGLLQLLLLIPFLVVSILFLWSQHKTLALIRPEYRRRMPPGQVWLQLIPLFGLGWQFYVISKISDSIRDDLNAPSGDSLFGDDPLPTGKRPTYATGISYAVLFCLTLLPLGLLKSLLALAGLIVWVIYWIELSGYTRRFKQRAF